MDVHCSTCNEPWDVYHLRHEAVFDTALSMEEAEAWVFLSSKERLTRKYREKFQAVGWQFGLTVVNVLRCPCCPKDAQANPAIVLTKGAMEELLADDEDALALMYEDHQL
jgi:hypothetical protein